MEKKILFLVTVILFTSCNTSLNKINVRISATSESNGEISFCVFPENEFGNIINGASISVNDGNNSITFLNFSNESQCYKGIINSISNEL